jgi:hypothetical protein
MLIIDLDDIPAFAQAELSATCAGIKACTKDGKPARLAIVDEAGQVLEAGADVERAAWLLMLLARRNFLEGNGHVRVQRRASE